MLKLKYLFDNRDLAEMILENWEYDLSSLKLFDYYRISSNAIYPFQYNGKTRLLRFSPVAERDKNNIIRELEFIRYLKSREYPVLSTVPSKDNKELVEVDTPWGKYFAVVFDRVAGIQLGEIEYTQEICRKHGEYLGKLHRLSSEYKPDKRLRWSYEDVLEWIEKELEDFPNEILAKQEAKMVRDYLSKIPKDDQNFGLIHYDFELDNIFYDQSADRLNIIDFDDAMYHWYAMDIERSLNNIISETSCEDYSMLRENFIMGYTQEFNVSDEMLLYMPMLRRFANLYGYTRVLVSAKETWDNEPRWMLDLRDKLMSIMEQDSMFFGKQIK
ncbi:phosphotransferase [Tissierella sp. MB52-C2]|uniref:phosphotransferase enzyme family protein n=1 Tax=Tissierella sp. MB52-C2 TaxID=3070999 RepID=UPI00280BC5D6|nr:phosphotransferase [Tissierella sp. MB52-C2]WMM23822.1 phosphotransferase [Tissierella sp. MB52-C2]